jgi:activating signal cointegrator complex subunit 3
VQNPSYYKCESHAPEAIHAFLVGTLARVFDDLVDAGCIAHGSGGSSGSGSSHADAEAVGPTPLGRIASYYYLEYTTIKRFNEAMSDGMQLPALLTALTAAAEFDELPVRHNEDLVNAELARIVPWPIAGAAPACFESPHAKAALLLQCHFSHLPLPVSDYYTDTKSVLDQTLRVANAMIDVAAERRWLTTALRVCSRVTSAF